MGIILKLNYNTQECLIGKRTFLLALIRSFNMNQDERLHRIERN